jgi:hypothetical protein
MRSDEFISENLKQWFKEKWVRFGPDGKIRGDCARGSSSEGKPKCLPQSKAHALGKAGRASSAAKKRREDPNPERRGPAKNVATRVKEDVNPKFATLIKNIQARIKKDDYQRPEIMKRVAQMVQQADPTVQDAMATARELVQQHGQGPVVKPTNVNDLKAQARSGNLMAQLPKTSAGTPSYAQQHATFEEQLDEKQDACYRKVKSRYKVWPSAYASGALVQCRKKGAANWGNKNESQETNMDELNRIVELSGAGPTEQEQEFDLIESIIDDLAVRNGVDAEMIWEDLETLTDDELYVFAVTTEPVMEDWQKANKKDRTAGMSQKAVNAYRRENPGSKLKTAVTTKPSKLKKGSKASKRRKSYCSRSRGQMKMHNISCAKTPDKAICAARRRWNC